MLTRAVTVVYGTELALAMYGCTLQSRSMQKTNVSPLPIKESMSNANQVSPHLTSQYGQGANSLLSGEDLRNMRIHSHQGDPYELRHLGSAASLPQAQSTCN